MADGDVLTIQSGHQTFAAPTGGVQVVYSATVELTHAQIKALPSTPVDIVPAPTAGTSLVFVSGTIAHTAWTPYGGLATGYPTMLAFGGVSESVILKSAGFLNDGSSDLATLPPLVNVGSGDYAGGIYANESIDPTVGIHLYMDNDTTSDLTGGDPANVLKVTVLYTVIDL